MDSLDAITLREEQNRRECRTPYQLALESAFNQIRAASKDGLHSVRLSFNAADCDSCSYNMNIKDVQRIKVELETRKFKCTKVHGKHIFNRECDSIIWTFVVSW